MANNRAVAIAKKHELWSLIKRLGGLWGEDEAFTAEYAKDVYSAYMEDLDGAIQCFKGLVEQKTKMGKFYGSKK